MSGNNQNDDDLKRRLRKHNDERLYLEADELMCEAADRIDQLEAERDEAVSAVQRLSEGQPFDAVVIADTVKRRTAQLESALRGMMDAYNDLCDESEPNYRSFKFRQEKWEAANAALGKGKP